MIAIEGDRLVVRFDRFGASDYDLFLRVKRLPEYAVDFDEATEGYRVSAPARFAPMLGVEVPAAPGLGLPLPKFLFDDQRAIVRMALDAKRFACWSDCGLGKTIVGLEFARQVVARTGGRVLVVTMNEVVGQWIDESHAFYRDKRKKAHTLDVLRLHSRAEMRHWMEHGQPGIAVTNYEKWNPDGLDDQVVTEARLLAGIILDESSRLKTGGGKQKWSLIKSCRGIEYKLSLTATPAPNDYMEFASQASFLEKMRDEGEIIWTYFCRDATSHRWTVKPHAREAFFRFLAGWSIYVRDPRRYGWRKGVPQPPAPVVRVHEIEATEGQRRQLLELSADPDGQMYLPGFGEERRTNAIQRMKLSQVAKGFRYRKGEDGAYDLVESRKPAFVAGLVREEVAAGAQVLVWTVFDAESELLAERLAAAGVEFDLLTGDTKERGRLDVLDRFKRGLSRVLVSRASMLGYGMNFQCCSAMIFSGWNDSYEAYYQAVRRAYRHGQTRAVRVHLPCVPELEGDMLDNLWRKQERHEAAIAEMERNFLEARREVEGKAS